MPSDVSLVAIRADERQRDLREKLPEIVRALQLKLGSMVGDPGTGYGYYPAASRRSSYSRTRVFAEEIDKVRDRLQADHLENSTLVLGTPTDPTFTKTILDAVIIADVHHEIEHPKVVLSRVKQALQPGDLLIVVDYLKTELRNQTRRDQAKEHNIAPAFVEHDLKDAGFSQAERRPRDPYLPRV